MPSKEKQRLKLAAVYEYKHNCHVTPLNMVGAPKQIVF